MCCSCIIDSLLTFSNISTGLSASKVKIDSSGKMRISNHSLRSYLSHIYFLSLPPLRWSIIISSFSHAFIIGICSVQCLLLAMLSAVGLCHRRFVPQSLSNQSYQIHLRRNVESRKTGRLSASSRTPAAGHRPAWEETEEAGETKSAGFYILSHLLICSKCTYIFKALLGSFAG